MNGLDCCSCTSLDMPACSYCENEIDAELFDLLKYIDEICQPFYNLITDATGNRWATQSSRVIVKQFLFPANKLQLSLTDIYANIATIVEVHCEDDPYIEINRFQIPLSDPKCFEKLADYINQMIGSKESSNE